MQGRGGQHVNRPTPSPSKHVRERLLGAEWKPDQIVGSQLNGSAIPGFVLEIMLLYLVLDGVWHQRI